ncbi:DHHA1 domain-containing protein, partial [uncultured Olegusella sp.]|uniref:DHHA1 domain-containing protein n=1 Tax=uncultured Olegusella sp. TaxID=1979846 RepID=UPI0026022C27
VKLNGVGGRDLRSVWDSIRDGAHKPEIACVLISATPDGKVALLAAASDSAVDAGFDSGKLIREIAGLVGGRGGGKAAMAQAGGADIAGIDAALAKAQQLLRS